MKTNKDIQNKIDSTFAVIESIGKVQASPFFKDKTMQLLFSEKEETDKIKLWFTPTWQLAVLVCLIALNIFVYKHFKSDVYKANISDFASSYGIIEANDTSMFN